VAQDEEDNIGRTEDGAEFYTSESERLNVRAAYLQSEIDKSKASIEEFRRKRQRAESNVEFYRTAQHKLDKAQTPLEIAERSLVLVGKMHAEGVIAHALAGRIKRIEGEVGLAG
jgi:hypothetical protein